MDLINQLAGQNPFRGDIVPSRVPLIQWGRPTLPFPHPGNYHVPLSILDSIFHGAEAHEGSARHNRYMSVPGLPYVLVTREPAVIKAVLLDTGDQPGEFDRDPSPMAGIARATGGNSLLYANGTTWHRQKKLAAPPFGRVSLFQPERFAEFEGTFRKTVAERLGALRALQAATGQRVTRIALETEIQIVMMEMLVNNFFGAEIPYEQLRNHYVPATIRLIAYMVSDTVIPRSRNLYKRFGRARRQFLDDVKAFEDLTLLALAGRPDGRGLWGHFKSDAPDDALKANVRVFLAGAIEATTSMASWALSHLSRNEILQEAVYEEVKNVDEYNPDNLRQAKVLNSVLTETLRLTPSLYFLPRLATEDRWITLDDGRRFMIPDATHVVLSVWHANRCEEFWGREVSGHPADVFAPERWEVLVRQGKKLGDLHHFGFGHGPRACPGKYLGMLEVGLVVGAMVKLFRLRAVTSTQEATAGVSTKPKDGVLVDLELRG